MRINTKNKLKVFSTILWRVLQAVQDGPVVPGRLGGELADGLHHLEILLTAGTLRNQVPLQVGDLLLCPPGGGQEN